jgi:hypothetical protein
MFNAVSRERLRELISQHFPTLEAFADVIYEEPGETYVRLENGEWEIIRVTEGFTQGCPVSPVFAALVLNDILSKIQLELNSRAEQRCINGEPGDDRLGTLGLILAYVDDCNILLHHEDILFFLNCFKELAEPIGASNLYLLCQSSQWMSCSGRSHGWFKGTWCSNRLSGICFNLHV